MVLACKEKNEHNSLDAFYEIKVNEKKEQNKKLPKEK